MRYAIAIIFLISCISGIQFIAASNGNEAEINKKIEAYTEILTSFDEIKNIKQFIKKLVHLKEQINESIEVLYLQKQKLILKIDKILLKIKNFFVNDNAISINNDLVSKVQTKNEINVERLNDITFIFDYFLNYNKNERKFIHNAIVNLVNLLNNNSVFGKINVFIIIPKDIDHIFEATKNLNKNVNILRYKKNNHQYSRIFTYLLNQIDTKYVFFGNKYMPPKSIIINNPDYAFQYFIKSITSLLDVLKTNHQANAIATGLIRNINSEIISVCAKSILKYYSLKYELLNVNSADDFIHCDYIYKGNFLARTRHLITIYNKLQYFDSDDLFFNNLFLELKLKNYQILLNPNVVFDSATKSNYAKNKSIEIFSSHNTNIKSKDLTFFMQNHEIEFIEVYDERKRLIFEYKINECKILNLNCKKNSLSKYHALPRCCRQILTNFIKHFENECKKQKVLFELDSGTLLGAVKFSSTLPWEIDGDISYFSEHHEKLKIVLKLLYEKFGYYFGYEKLPVNKVKGGQFLVYAEPYWIELYGLSKEHFMDTLNSTIGQTKIKVDETWASGPVSPGLWVRNRYGVNLFKHALSWRYLGLQHSFESYSNQVNNGYCPVKGYHSCMSALGNDGNFQYN